MKQSNIYAKIFKSMNMCYLLLCPIYLYRDINIPLYLI